MREMHITFTVLVIFLPYLTKAQFLAGSIGINGQPCFIYNNGIGIISNLGGYQNIQGVCYPDLIVQSLGITSNIQVAQGTCPTNSKCLVTNTNPNNGLNGQCGIKGNGGNNGGLLSGGTIPILPRVLGGVDSFGSEWCWQAAVMSGNNFLAGGVLINNQWVLTSAFRLYSQQGYSNNLQVQLGGQTLNNNYGIGGFTGLGGGCSVTKNVIQVIIHEQYNPGSPFYENNIALLKLDTPVDTTQSSCVCTICLPAPNQDFSNTYSYRQCTVTGYGSAYGPGSANSQTLKVINVPIVNDYQCMNALKTYAANKNVNIHPSYICAGGEQGRDACTGDGGSPLACEENGRYTLAGIVSWGLGCGNQNIPGVYTKVSYFVNWINAKTSNNVPYPIYG